MTFPSNAGLDAVDAKLEAEGFWEEVKRKYGTKPSVSSNKQPSQGLQNPQASESKRV
jgi:hypothetical protein